MKPLPENFLRCMTLEARKSVGQRTAAEVMANGVATSEKALQKQIVGLLRLKGIEVNVSRMDKRKTDKIGWPDITFAVYDAGMMVTYACAWEAKLPQGKLSPEQVNTAAAIQMGPNAWTYRLIRSVDEALAELKEMGVA